ncbi:MAG: class I SAM-dependent methyltransferase [Bacteroidota bacterium]
MPRTGFDHIAFIYDWLAKLVYGEGILRAATLGFDEVRQEDRMLILGGGTGKILTFLADGYFPKEIVYIEPSAKMMAKAQKVWASLDVPSTVSIKWILGTDRYLEGKQEYEILLTPFVLDLFPEAELRKIFLRLHKSLKQGGSWLYADFFLKNDNYHFLRKGLLGFMYLFFKLICGVENDKLPETDKLFEKYGYIKRRRKEFSSAMIEGIVYQKP